jgi:predicted  nucleic acid-binding Zn-ribbon protein
MPHQCTRCGQLFPDAAAELLKGCTCGSKFFYYIKQERLDEIKEERAREMNDVIQELNKIDKDKIEKDIREITGMENEPEKPVILDLESVRVIKPGKFEIDVVNLFNKRRPLIYKLEEGKYIIDLAASLNVDKNELARKIRDPSLFLDRTKDEEIKKPDIKDEKEGEMEGEIKEENEESQDEEDVERGKEINEKEEEKKEENIKDNQIIKDEKNKESPVS